MKTVIGYWHKHRYGSNSGSSILARLTTEPKIISIQLFSFWRSLFVYLLSTSNNKAPEVAPLRSYYRGLAI